MNNQFEENKSEEEIKRFIEKKLTLIFSLPEEERAEKIEELKDNFPNHNAFIDTAVKIFIVIVKQNKEEKKSTDN